MPYPTSFPDIWTIALPLIKAFWPYLALEIGLLVVIRLLDPESTKYFLQRNKIEILTTFFAVIGYAASYFYVQQPERSFFINVGISLAADPDPKI
jgi:beta-lactamase regulating signal transducer with metallopeptidase domain